jgi:hypothetical protein
VLSRHLPPVAGTCVITASGTFASLACGAESLLRTTSIVTSAVSLTLNLGIDTMDVVGVVIPTQWNQAYSVDGVVQLAPYSLFCPIPTWWEFRIARGLHSAEQEPTNSKVARTGDGGARQTSESVDEAQPV